MDNPDRAGWLINRPRLRRVFRGACRRRVTVVSAPAGYGKSVALRQFLEMEQAPYVLYRVTRKTDSLRAFVRGLSDSMMQAVPGTRLSFALAFESASNAKDTAMHLVSWFCEHLRERRLVIAIDDFQYAADPEIGRFLAACVERVHEQITWIFATRDPSNLPITRWLSSGTMAVPIDESDLRFRANEIQVLARQNAPHASAAVMKKAAAVTAGWPAVLGAAIECADILPKSARNERNLYEKLACTLLERSGDAEFFVRTAVFPSLRVDVLHAAGWANADSLLRDMCRRAGCVEQDADGAFRYDNVFREFLFAQLEERGTRSSRAATLKCSAALEAAGEFAQALSLYTATRARTKIASLLEARGLDLVDAGWGDIVQDSMHVLTEREQLSNPLLMAIAAVLAAQRGHFDASEAWFTLAIENANDAQTGTRLAYRYALDLIRRGRTDCIDMLRERLPAAGELEASYCCTLATAYVLCGQLPQAKRVLKRGLGALREDNEPAVRARAYHQAAYVALRAGDIAESRRLADAAWTLATQCGMYDVASRAFSILYEIAFSFDCDPVAALDYIERVGEYAAKSGNSHVRLWALLGAYYVEAERGNAQAMAAIEELLNAADVVQNQAETMSALLPARALRAAWDGDFERAYKLLAHTADPQYPEDRLALRHAEIALYAAASGHTNEAAAAAGAARKALKAVRRQTKHSLQARGYTILALVLLNRRAIAATLATHHGPVRAPSLRAFFATIRRLYERSVGRPNHVEVADSLDEMRVHHLGGLAAMIENLPKMSLAAYKK